MKTPEGMRIVIEALNAIDIPYMIVGSFSSMAYGEARATLDADFVVETDEVIGEIRRRLEPQFAMDPQVGFETKRMTTKYVFIQRETKFKVELFLLSDDPHDLARFEGRKAVTWGDLHTWIPRPEDVIIQKLRWRRKKDREDVASVIRVSGAILDWPYIHQWCDRHGTRPLLDEVRREASQG